MPVASPVSLPAAQAAYPRLAINGLFYGEEGATCVARIYRNECLDTFTAMEVPLPGLQYGSLVWGDYDDDQDLDLPVSSATCTYKPVTRLYRNECPNPHSPHRPPVHLTSQLVGWVVTLSWDSADDAATPGAGLSHQLRVGTRPRADNAYSGMADPATGRRRKPGQGRLGQRLSCSIEGLNAPR